MGENSGKDNHYDDQTNNNHQDSLDILSGDALRKKLLSTQKEQQLMLDNPNLEELNHSTESSAESSENVANNDSNVLDNTSRLAGSSESSEASQTISSIDTIESPSVGSRENRSSEYIEDEKNLTNSEKKKMTRKKEDRLVRKIVLVVVAALIVSMAIFGFSFYRYWTSGLQPLNPEDSQLKQVHIPFQSTTKDIGSILEKDKVIKSGFVFSYYVKMNNLTDFQAGYYQMSPDMTLNQIALLLQEGGTDEPVAIADARITIPEGYTIEQIADLIDKNTEYSKDDFLDLMKDEEYFNELVEDFPELLTSAQEAQGVRYRLEGYLFPATYNYYADQSLNDFVKKMVSTTNQVLTPYYDKITEEGLTVQQVLTLASLVEKEGVTDSDRRKIAQVFFNRLNQEEPMPLQSDISIIYALNEHKVHLSNEDTQVDSPYNLYINPGYGPGPFDNPGEQAIKAVLDPDTTVSELYFLANVETGEIFFANTYEEHLELKKEHIDNQQ